MEKYAAGNCGDLPESSDRALMKQLLLYPGDANLKKRKLISGSVEGLNEPAAKHKCKSEELAMKFLETKDINVFAVNMEIMDVTNKSAQDTNSSPRNSSSSHDKSQSPETCASWSNFLSDLSRLDGSISSSIHHQHEEIVNSHQGLYPHQNNGFPDIDCLNECFNVDLTGKQRSAEGLEEFIVATGVDPSMFLQPSEKWGLSQDAQLDKQKPTIDKEFEQYFSMLML